MTDQLKSGSPESVKGEERAPTKPKALALGLLDELFVAGRNYQKALDAVDPEAEGAASYRAIQICAQIGELERSSLPSPPEITEAIDVLIVRAKRCANINPLPTFEPDLAAARSRLESLFREQREALKQAEVARDGYWKIVCQNAAALASLHKEQLTDE